MTKLKDQFTIVVKRKKIQKIMEVKLEDQEGLTLLP